MLRQECVCLGSEIKDLVDGLVGCLSGSYGGVDPEALDGGQLGKLLVFAKEMLP